MEKLRGPLGWDQEGPQGHSAFTEQGLGWTVWQSLARPQPPGVPPRLPWPPPVIIINRAPCNWKINLPSS